MFIIIKGLVFLTMNVSENCINVNVKYIIGENGEIKLMGKKTPIRTVEDKKCRISEFKEAATSEQD